MYKGILLVIVWSLTIIGIGSQPEDYDLEVIENLHLDYDYDGDDDDNDVDNDNSDDDSLPKISLLLKKNLDIIVRIFENVVLYFSKESNKKSSSSSRKNPNKPDDIEVLALSFTTFFTFGMAVTSRIYSLYYLCIFGNQPENKFDFYFDEMMFAFNMFKKEIKKYVKDDRKKKDSRSRSINAVMDIESSRDDITIEEAARKISNLSLDFVSSKKTLMKKKPDKYVNGIINWNCIREIKINKLAYKTIFPSCSFIRMSIHKVFTEEEDSNNEVPQNSETRKKLQKRYNIRIRDELYSTEDYWQSIMDDINSVFENEVPTKVFSFLLQKLRSVLDVSTLFKLQDFFLKKTIGSDWNIISPILNNRDYGVPYFQDSSNMFHKLNNENENFRKENTEMSTQKRIENVAALVRRIREAK